MSVCVCVCLCVHIWYPQGLSADATSRLHDFSFEYSNIDLYFENFMTITGKLHGLRRAWEQVAEVHLSAPAGITLQDMEWTPALAQTVCDLISLLPHNIHDVAVCEDPTDESMAVLLSMGTHIKRLELIHLNLQSEQHASVPWPWDEVTLCCVEPRSLLRLPNPRGRSKPPTVLREEVWDMDVSEVRLVSHRIMPT